MMSTAADELAVIDEAPPEAGGTLVPTNGPAALALAHALGARFDHTSLSVEDPDLPFEAWENIGRAIGFVGSTWHWWLGDWFNIGEELYGDKAAAVVDDIATRYEVARRVTGNATGTLQNIRSICKRVAQPVRRPELSIWTHSEVAKLEPDDQREWLDKAVEERWQRSELRRALRGGDPNAVPGEDPEDPVPPAHAGVSVEERIREAARLVLAQGSIIDDVVHVPLEPWRQLQAAFGGE